MSRALTVCTRAEEAYYEITRRIFDGELFEGTVLDVYADCKNESKYGIFDSDDIPSIDEMVPIINDEIMYLIEQFCTMSGVDEGDIPAAIFQWQSEMFPILSKMIEGVLLKHGKVFESESILSLAGISDNILPCQNILFSEFIKGGVKEWSQVYLGAGNIMMRR